MSKRHLKASRLKYLDRQKALCDRAKPELVDRYCLRSIPAQLSYRIMRDYL